ncbi:MAG: energy transducer TonB [Candidatus Anammoxibacter sp.]
MKILIPFLIAIVIHVAFLFAGNSIYKPAEVYFQPGQSAIQMKLVSSIANPESKKLSTVKNEIDEVIEEPGKLPEPEKITKPDLIPDQEAIIDNTLNKTDQQITENRTVDEQKQTAKVSEIDLNEIDDQVNEQDTEADSVPSTEIVADLMSKGVTSPTVLGVEKPKYPLGCRRKGHEGVTVLEATIDKNGKCTNIRVTSSAGCEKMDKSAIKTLKRAKFIPAERFGIKIPGIKKIAFKFRIEDID